MHPLYSSEFAERIEAAIEEAESRTSCEFKVHLEDFCEEDVFDRAAYVFSELNLHKTKARNAILVFVVVQNRKVVILADAGVTSVLNNTLIDEEVKNMTEAFRSGMYVSGVAESLGRMSRYLSPIFPREANDINEISNSISR
jgi:uncharacterized membrane protein